MRWAPILLLTFVLAGCLGGDDDPVATPTPEATATPSPGSEPTESPATPTPHPFFSQARALRAGDPVSLPAGVVVYSRDGIWEGSGGSVRRWFADSAGKLVVEEILASRVGEEPFALTSVFATGTGEMWATMCHGICYGMPEPISILRSTDGGATWQEVTRLPEGGWGTLIGVDGRALIVYQNGTPNPARITPGEPPRPLPYEVVLGRRLVAGYHGDKLQMSVLSEDGRTIQDVFSGEQTQIPVPDPFQFISVDGYTPGAEDRIAVTWRGSGDPAAADMYLGFLDLANGAFTGVYRWRLSDGLGEGLQIAGWLAEGVAFGRAQFDAAAYMPGTASHYGGVPAVIDFNTGVVSPIRDFVAMLANKSGGPVPFHVETGTFLKVVANGDCLNVRAGVGVGEPVLACYADGVLLRLREDVQPAEGWTPVETRDGREGWASSEFLVAP